MKALNILVVEDDLLMAELLSEVIVELGHAVCAIETTEAGAVAAAARHGPDLIIIDAQLGHGSGISAMESIIMTGRVAHLFVSGDISKVLALRPGAVALQKPFNEEALLVAMDLALAAAR